MTRFRLRPVISLSDRPGFTVCNCCGTKDDTVRLLSFKWEETSTRVHQGGGTSVALCSGCRGLTREVLSAETRT
jgi:bacterioferritin-associated ferredoxin